MATAKEIRDHIVSIKKTHKITKAMYLISSAKMSRAKAELDQTRPYFSALQAEIKRIFRTVEDADSPYIYPDVLPTHPDGVFGCLVITADKGLAGSYNLNVIREAEALLAGIVLDTKSFTIRTGERTFDAAAYLRRAGADTTDVKKLLQTDMDDTVAKYKILQSAKLYRNLAIAVPEEPQNRVVAASAADELLNISGVDASIVVAPDGNGGSFASARSIGELNVQLIMEKVGGGGNRSAAAAQFAGTDVNTAVKRIYAAIDDYLG